MNNSLFLIIYFLIFLNNNYICYGDFSVYTNKDFGQRMFSKHQTIDVSDTQAMNDRDLDQSPTPILHVHIIPHSHCDPGWLDTFEGYYKKDVSYIIKGVIDALKENPTRRFIWAETSFFRLWFIQQTPAMQQEWIDLVNQGQIEHVGGGWVQHDEATPNSYEIIHQMKVGLSFLKENIGVIPQVAWQIDPFGHSRSSVKGFDFEERESPQLLNKDISFIKQRADKFYHEIMKRKTAYLSSSSSTLSSHHMLVPWGDDFKFRRTFLQFKNMDILINYINSHPEFYHISLQYSTLSEYFSQLNISHLNLHSLYPLYQYDFYPYADNSDSYWTGFYTTRPIMKRTVRNFQNILRESIILSFLSSTYFQGEEAIMISNKIQNALEMFGLLLHHDAITGTSRQFVIRLILKDYLTKSKNAIQELSLLKAKLLSVHIQGSSSSLELTSQKYLMIASKSMNIYHLTLFNSLNMDQTALIIVETNTPFVKVVHNDQIITSQISLVLNEDDSMIVKKKYKLSFIFKTLPLSTISFLIYLSPNKDEIAFSERAVYVNSIQYISDSNLQNNPLLKKTIFNSYLPLQNSSISIQNHRFILTFNNNGLPLNLFSKQSQILYPFHFSFFSYPTRRSGAYIFRPSENAVEHKAEKTKVRVIQGPIVDSVEAFLDLHHYQISLIHDESKSSNSLISSLVIEMDIAPIMNKETIVRFITIPRLSHFYSFDSIQLSLRNPSPLPPLSTFSYSSQYYPCSAGAVLSTSSFSSSRDLAFHILIDHTVGCASLRNGEIEFMLHRSLNQDDGRGLGERVRDDTISKTQMNIFLEESRAIPLPNPGKLPSLSLYHQYLSLIYPPSIYIQKPPSIVPFYWNISFLHQSIPKDLHLVQMNYLNNDEMTLTFQSLTPFSSSPLNFSQIFGQSNTIRDVTEVSLSDTIITTLPLKTLPIFSPLNFSILNTMSGVNPTSSQYSLEKGVFISQAALHRSQRRMLNLKDSEFQPENPIMKENLKKPEPFNSRESSIKPYNSLPLPSIPVEKSELFDYHRPFFISYILSWFSITPTVKHYPLFLIL